jgi:hypothetical protein
MELNAFSRAFADHLFRAFPEWRALARVEREDGEETGYLIVEVPSASGAAEPLSVWTVDDEVTVSFDAFHTHFWWPVGEAEVSSAEDPITFIREILTETLVVVSWWNEGEARRSTAQPAAEAVELSGGRERITRARVRSWKGTFDREVQTSSP